MKRTISIKLAVDQAQNDALLQLEQQFTQACNLVAECAEKESKAQSSKAPSLVLQYIAHNAS